MACGLSLGEYTALCFAGVFGFTDGVRLTQVRRRGLGGGTQTSCCCASFLARGLGACPHSFLAPHVCPLLCLSLLCAWRVLGLKARGAAMQAASDLTPSSMATVVGLSREKVEELCAVASERTGEMVGGVVAVGHWTSGAMIVVSARETFALWSHAPLVAS